VELSSRVALQPLAAAKTGNVSLIEAPLLVVAVQALRIARELIYIDKYHCSLLRR